MPIPNSTQTPAMKPAMPTGGPAPAAAPKAAPGAPAAGADVGKPMGAQEMMKVQADFVSGLNNVYKGGIILGKADPQLGQTITAALDSIVKALESKAGGGQNQGAVQPPIQGQGPQRGPMPMNMNTRPVNAAPGAVPLM